MNILQLLEKVHVLEQTIHRLESQLQKHLKPYKNARINTLSLGQEGVEAKLEIQQKKGPSPPVFLLQAPETGSIQMHSTNTIELKGENLHLQAPSILLESESIVIEGELAAKIRYSSPFIWRNGQKKLRLLPAAQGFPVITKLVLKTKSSKNSSSNLYIDPKDQYWYVKGSKDIEQLGVIFVGMV